MADNTLTTLNFKHFDTFNTFSTMKMSSAPTDDAYVKYVIDDKGLITESSKGSGTPDFSYGDLIMIKDKRLLFTHNTFYYAIYVNGGNVKLTEYVLGTDNGNILATDTVNEAFSKLENRINSLKDRVLDLEKELSFVEISNVLTNATTDNDAASIMRGKAYSAKITPDEGYNLVGVNVQMGTEDVTAMVYDASTGTITIDEVTGNLLITCTTSRIQFTVTRTLNHVALDNNNNNVDYGTSYVANITPNNGYDISTVTVTMGGTNITSTAYNNGVINIAKVTGNIVINASGALRNIEITENYTNATSNYDQSKIYYGDNVDITVTPNEGYEFVNGNYHVYVGVNDVTKTSTSLNNGHLEIGLINVNDNIIIEAVATVQKLRVIYEFNDRLDANAQYGYDPEDIIYGEVCDGWVMAENNYEITGIRFTDANGEVDSRRVALNTEYYEDNIAHNAIKTYNFEISDVTSSITAHVTLDKMESVTINNGTGVTNDYDGTLHVSGSNLEINFHIEEGYEFGTPTVTIGKIPSSDFTWRYGEFVLLDGYINGDVVITIPSSKKTFGITKTLSNVTLSNSATSIEYGDTYTTTFTPTSGYTIRTINVTMGGRTISVTGNTINIPNVTGEIAIELVASKNQYNITSDLTNVHLSNADDMIDHGQPYNCFVLPDENYNIGEVLVMMGGEDVTSTVYNQTQHQIFISSVTGDIHIIANATTVSYKITYILSEHLELSNMADTASAGSSYLTNITTEPGFAIISYAVLMRGQNITASSYSLGRIEIDNITGDVTIQLTAGESSIPTIGRVSSNNEILINDDVLSSGYTYLMVYEDADGNPIQYVDKIEKFTL